MKREQPEDRRQGEDKGSVPLDEIERTDRCEDRASRELEDGEQAPPGPRGACAKKSRSQGSE